MPHNDLSVLSQLGMRVAYLRKQKKMSQLDLSLMAKISSSYLCDLEKGRRNPSVLVLERIASSLDTTLEDLFRGIISLEELSI